MILGKICNSLIFPNLSCNSVYGIRFYTVFPPEYVKPIFRKDEQEAELKKLAYVPIKPAGTSDTCSQFYDPLVRKFTNYIMREGKKSVARKLLEETFENVKAIQLEKYFDTAPEYRDQIILDPKEILHHAVKNGTPVLELQKIRKGGIAYQVPVPMNENRAQFLSMNWLIQTAHEKAKNERFTRVLAKELVDTANNKGRVIKKKQDLHKRCEGNRAYAHYRWL